MTRSDDSARVRRSDDSARVRRSADQIATTPTGPRSLPPLGRQGVATAPAGTDTVLDNGLRVMTVHRPAVPMVELRLSVPFGGTDAAHAAHAEVLAATLLCGTPSRDRFGIDTELATIGADLGSSVDPERLSIGGSALASELPRLLEVLADALTAATHPDGEVARERARLVERLAIGRSQPRVIAREALQRRRYGDHPAAREVPEPDQVEQVTPDAVRALHQRGVVPRGAVLVLVGDIAPERARDTAAWALGGWRSDRPATELTPLPKVTGGELELVHREDAVQSQLRLSAAAVPRTDPSYPALQLANLIFGGYFSSRWVENLREDKGYTYGAHSRVEFSPHGASLVAETDTASEVSAAALLETRYELGRVAVTGPNTDEVESARRYAQGSLTISTASQAGLAANLAALASVGLDLSWLRAHPERLQAVTRDEVADAAAVFFAPSGFTGVIVGDAGRLAAPLRALGGVRVP